MIAIYLSGCTAIETPSIVISSPRVPTQTQSISATEPQNSAEVSNINEGQITFEYIDALDADNYIIQINNGYNESISVDLSSVSINGWSVSGSSHVEVPALTSQNINLNLLQADRNRIGISNVTNKVFRFKITSSKGIEYFSLRNGDTQISELQLTGTSLAWEYISESFRISKPLYIYDNVSEKNVIALIIENNTESDIIASVKQITIGNKNYDYFGQQVLQSNTSGIIYLETNEENIIANSTEIDDVTFLLYLSYNETGAGIDAIKCSLA